MTMNDRRWERRDVVATFGQWCVTAGGIENLRGPCSYEIDAAALGHPWWSDHMREKNWVHADDFDAALAFAREYFRNPSCPRCEERAPHDSLITSEKVTGG
jgi:hypothetical protein